MIDLSVCVLPLSVPFCRREPGSSQLWYSSKAGVFLAKRVTLRLAEVAHLATTLDGRTILEVAGQPVFGMNPVAVSIWTRLAAGLSIQEINAQIAEEFGVSEERVTSDVAKFIDVLKDRLLVYDEG